MAKKKQVSKYSPRVFIIIGLGLVVLASIVFLVKMFVLNPLSTAYDSSGTVAIREIVIDAARGLKADAMVDPKTADIYFPQAKLFLPAAKEFSIESYTYAHEPNGEYGKELSVSTKHLFSKSAIKLYSAEDVTKMFEQIPQLQACQRGVRILEKDPGLDDKTPLLQKITVDDGRTLYMFGEEKCSELADVAERLTALKSF